MTPLLATQNSACLGHLGQHNKKKKQSYLCHIAQGGQGKYCFVSLLLTVSLTNFANVNDPLTRHLI
jgi:hypothetical protein